MSIANLISLLGGVALFLFGMSLMGEGLKRVAGNQLELVLYRLSSTPVKGVLLGMGITAVIQSSSATSVMVIGFVNSGMMQLNQAIGVIMGSFIGTSITGWVICLSSLPGGSGWVSLISTATLTGTVAVIGIILRMFCKNQTKVHIGDILLGFAVLMFGISAMGEAVAPLKDSETFAAMMTHFSNPLLGVLAGLLITAVLQSCSSTVGLVQALAVTGLIDFSIAFPVIVGIAIGASVPVLLSSIGANTAARRSAWSYLSISIYGAIMTGLLFYPANAIFHFPFMDTTMTAASIALVNSVYRAAAVLLLLPLLRPLEKLLARLIPDKVEPEENIIPPLEERFLLNPALAIEHSREAIFAMADVSRKNILSSIALLRDYSAEDFRAVQERENIVDRYEDRLGSYLVRITSLELDPRQTAEVSKFLHAIGDLERISDHAVNIAEAAQELHNKRISFSAAAVHELRVLGEAVSECLELALRAFEENDMDSAYRVEPLEELVDNLCDELKLHHIDRLQKGTCTLENGFVFNDIVTNYERVSDHCSNLAVAVIELDSSGRFDPHEYLDSLKELRTGCFDRYYDEYSAKYAV